MRVPARALLAVALGGAAAAAPAAHAATNCFGPSTAYVCVVTPRVVLGERTECIYTGGTTCDDYTIPTVGTEGPLTYYCGGRIDCVSPAT